MKEQSEIVVSNIVNTQKMMILNYTTESLLLASVLNIVSKYIWKLALHCTAESENSSCLLRPVSSQREDEFTT